jgi:hypothetical protein
MGFACLLAGVAHWLRETRVGYINIALTCDVDGDCFWSVAV